MTPVLRLRIPIVFATRNFSAALPKILIADLAQETTEIKGSLAICLLPSFLFLAPLSCGDSLDSCIHHVDRKETSSRQGWRITGSWVRLAQEGKLRAHPTGTRQQDQCRQGGRYHHHPSVNHRRSSFWCDLRVAASTRTQHEDPGLKRKRTDERRLGYTVMSFEQDNEPRRGTAVGQDVAGNTLASMPLNDWETLGTSSISRNQMPHLTEGSEPLPPLNVGFHEAPGEPSRATDALSPAASERIFPIRSVVSAKPSTKAADAPRRQHDIYFPRLASTEKGSEDALGGSHHNSASRKPHDVHRGAGGFMGRSHYLNQDGNIENPKDQSATPVTPTNPLSPSQQQPPDVLANMLVGVNDNDGSDATAPSEALMSTGTPSTRGGLDDYETRPLVTARFKHIVTEGGHAVITGRDGDTLQRCEDEPIHIPGAVQGFGLLIALQKKDESRLIVRVVSENSKSIIGYTPKQLFALESFTDVLSEEQAENLLDHVDFVRDEGTDVTANGPEVFTMSIRPPSQKHIKLWCAVHTNERNSNLVICEFELEDDHECPLMPLSEATLEHPEDKLQSLPTEAEFAESTQNTSQPLRILRNARKHRGEAAAMEVFNIVSQVQEQLAAAASLAQLLKTLVGIVKELTGFHRVMIYQFDQAWHGRVVTELVDPNTTRDIYKGLNFPASDIPKQARELYKVNKVRMLYDRDQDTARLVCRTVEDLETPLDLTHSYLRAMSPIHIKYLGNMGVRSSMSISITAFEELWGLISCHTYGSYGMRVSFPIRNMCRLIGDSASREVERLSYVSRLQARKLINTVSTKENPSGCIIASSEDLVKLFDSDFGLLSIRGETKILGKVDESHEVLAMLAYLRMRSITSITTSQNIHEDFPDLRYTPGFKIIAGLLLVPLSAKGEDFIVFFRKGQVKEVKWAGNPYEKSIKEGTEGYLEPRESFRVWCESVVGKCREWADEEIETATVLCLVYGKFIRIWREKEQTLQNSRLTELLLANSAHEVRTPLNAIINYLEIALEGSLDQETRDSLVRSHSASKSLVYVINDLLDLTMTGEGEGGEFTKNEAFNLGYVLKEATDMFADDARRKNIAYDVKDHPELPTYVMGDGRRVRQAISNLTANAVQNTTEGSVRVEVFLAACHEQRVDVEICISDTGVGINSEKIDALFRELEQVQTVGDRLLESPVISSRALPDPDTSEESRVLGNGLAVVARILRNMNGQLRLKSEEGKGTRFVIQLSFDLPDSAPQQQPALTDPATIETTSTMSHAGTSNNALTVPQMSGELILVARGRAIRSPSSLGARAILHERSAESVGSKNSVRSARSGHSDVSLLSVGSRKSHAD
jgi:light-regulated signal transduction histidine kinase (bacteriophytochrome)